MAFDIPCCCHQRISVQSHIPINDVITIKLIHVLSTYQRNAFSIPMCSFKGEPTKMFL